MFALRYLLLVVVLFLGNLTILISQDTSKQVAPAQKILLGGKEYFLHVVQHGEGLYRIGVNYGVSQQEIMDANHDITVDLKVGQIIRVPIIKGRNSNSQELSRSRTYMYHTVEKGQTAYSISKQYNIPIESIYENNIGTQEGLVEGAILRIPVLTSDKNVVSSVNEPDSFIYHTVEPKETLYGIAREYNTTINVIIEANPALRDGKLPIGSKVRIPKNVVEAVNIVKVSPDGTQRFIDGDKFLYHSIQTGQTFYSISRQYQVDVEKIKAANPGVSQDDLKVGNMLRVPRPSVSSTLQQPQVSDARLYTSHKVTRKETIYGISRKYNIDMETIKGVNPEIDFNKLKKGVILRIPTDEWFASRTASVLSQVVVPDSVNEEQLPVYEYGDCSGNSVLGHNVPIKVALLFPFGANEASRFSNIADSSGVMHSLPTSASRGKVFFEFYSGMLLALDTLKKEGVNVELSVFDISHDSLALKKVLENKSLVDADLIIGPALAQELPLLSEFSLKHQIPLVYPMSNTNPELTRNPYLFHINTPDSLYFNQMANEIVHQAAGSTLIVILPPESETSASLFVNHLRLQANQKNGKTINYIEYRSKGNDLGALQNIINKEGPNFIVVPSVDEASVSKIIPILAGVKEISKANITLFGMSDWLRFQTIDPEQIHQLNGSIFSPFGIDYKQKQTTQFIKKYRSWFHTEPHAISPYFQNSGISSNYSRYGIWGYDVSMYFISAIYRFGSDFDLCLNNFQHDEIQFNFDFKRISNWGGFYNHGLFFIKFHSDFTTERIPVVIR